MKLKKWMLLGGLLMAPAVVSRLIEAKAPALPEPKGDEFGYFPWTDGTGFYQKKGSGEPLVLMHGVSFGASSWEWRNNLDALAEHFTVYAFDLPGFGKSEHRPIVYDADLYTRFINDFMREIVGKPAYAIGSSLTGAYLARAAYSNPERFKKIALVCPTGLEKLVGGQTIWRSFRHSLLSIPLFGDTLYQWIGSKKYVRKYLEEQIYWNRSLINEAMVEHYYAAGHQKNSRYALQSFITGMLNCDLRAIYPQIERSMFILWGQHATVTPVTNAQAFIQQNARATLHVFQQSGLLPHDEEAGTFNQLVIEYFKQN